jgi:hypothetical protein
MQIEPLLTALFNYIIVIKFIKTSVFHSENFCPLYIVTLNMKAELFHTVLLENWILMVGWPCIVVYITLVDFQLNVQISYLFTYNTFIKILYMFRALLCSSYGLRRNCIYAASGIVTLCRWLSCAPVKEQLTITVAAYIYNYDVDFLKMSGIMLESCRGF